MFLRTPSRHEVNNGRRKRRGLKHTRGLVDPAAVARRFTERGRAEHGFTLIEVLVAALITLIISAGVATALVGSTDFTSRERNQSQSNEVAQQDQERMKAMTDAQLTSLHQTRIVTLNNTKLTVTSTAAFEDATGGSSCTSKGQAYFKLTSTVSTTPTPGNPAQSVTAETIVTRSLAGSLLVQVNNQTAAPLSGAAVAIAGQNTKYGASATTDANGCVAFAGLPTDTYTINATDPGYVDPNGNTTATEAVGVTQTSIASPPTLILGPAGAVRVGFVTKGMSANGYELSYYGSGGGNNMSGNACLMSSTPTPPTVTKCTATGSPAINFTASNPVGAFIPGNLFPFYLGSSAQYTNNYQVWAGSCEQEQPLQPPAGTGFASVTAGKAASTTTPDALVAEPAIDVGVKYNNGPVVAPASVTITFTGKNSSGATSCVDIWRNVTSVGPDTVGGVTTYGAFPAPFASQATKGTAGASATGDQGSIQVCAYYNGYHATTTTALTTNLSTPTPVPLMDVKTGGTSGNCP
jgi:prepilin-type N-terminal cleavage/methylation domain-containing protein